MAEDSMSFGNWWGDEIAAAQQPPPVDLATQLRRQASAGQPIDWGSITPTNKTEGSSYVPQGIQGESNGAWDATNAAPSPVAEALRNDPYAKIRNLDAQFNQGYTLSGDPEAGGAQSVGDSWSWTGDQENAWREGGFQSKYNNIQDLGDGRLQVTMQRPGGKYDTMEAIYSKDAEGKWTLQNDPMEMASQQKASGPGGIVGKSFDFLSKIPGSPEAALKGLEGGLSGDLSWNPYSKDGPSVWDYGAGGTKFAEEDKTRQIGRTVGTLVGGAFAGPALSGALGGGTAGAAGSGAIIGGGKAALEGGSFKDVMMGAVKGAILSAAANGAKEFFNPATKTFEAMPELSPQDLDYLQTSTELGIGPVNLEDYLPGGGGAPLGGTDILGGLGGMDQVTNLENAFGGGAYGTEGFRGTGELADLAGDEGGIHAIFDGPKTLEEAGNNLVNGDQPQYLDTDLPPIDYSTPPPLVEAPIPNIPTDYSKLIKSVMSNAAKLFDLGGGGGGTPTTKGGSGSGGNAMASALRGQGEVKILDPNYRRLTPQQQMLMQFQSLPDDEEE